MIEEASAIVSLTVELTNLAWTNNTKKQQEINDSTMSVSHQQEQERQAAAVVADADDSLSSTVANIIADDDDSIYIPPATGRRSRANSVDDMIMGPPGSNVHIVRQELSFCGGSSNGLSSLPVVSEEETDEHQDQEEEAPTNTTVVAAAAAVSSSSTSSGDAAPTMTKTATFTNLDVVHRDANIERKRKSRDFVSVDQSFVSELLDEEQQEHDLQEHDFNNDVAAPEDDTHKNSDVNVDVDAEYYKVAAERACSIVDFVFAGEEIDMKFMDVMLPSSSAKRLRFE